MQWERNGKYTLIGISDMLAMTSKNELCVKDLDANGEPIFVQRGKRKRWMLRNGVGREKLVFEGWDIPLKVDSEQTGSYVTCGNACFNFLGSPEFVRDFIDKNNKNEYFARHDSILAHGEKVLSGRDGIPVYPETPTTHAVVLKIREKLGMKEAPEVVYSYSREEAKEDGILTDNPRRDVFNECDIVTTHLLEKIENEIAMTRNLKRVFPYNPLELMGCVMVAGKEIYENQKFEGDQNKDFFTTEKTEEGVEIWFVRNENARLTAMLPEDY